jgi:hypothetical protein
VSLNSPNTAFLTLKGTKKPFRPIRNVPVNSGQQAPDHSISDCVQGVQEQLHVSLLAVPYLVVEIDFRLQLERVDHSANQVLRPTSQLSGYIYGLGY